MSKINSMLDVGKRSLMNSQTALQTVGHNIANKSTEGYSRQRVEQVTAEPVGVGKLRLGMGSKSAAITRVSNPYLEKQLGKEQSHLGFLGGRADAMSRVEQVYNEQMNKGLNQSMTDFFNSYRELSHNPENLASRTLVKETADFMAKDFHRVNDQLIDIQRDLDQQIVTDVSEINEMTEEVARLNEKVQQVELSGGYANDERDRRDLLVKKIGEKVNIRWAEGDNGMVAISAGNTALLVTGYDAKKLVVQPTAESATKGEGNFDVFFQNTNDSIPIKVTEQLTGGTLGGLLDVRDHVITGLMSDVDQMAATLAAKVNEAHVAGFDAYGKPAGQFFSPLLQLRHAARELKVDAQVLKDPNRIATAAVINAPGDNRIANYISNLQYKKVLDGGGASLDEFYNAMVGRVGVIARRANIAHESQKDIVKQLGNIRESISGVSLDEETTKMIEFQKAFDASARLIRTADEMFDTVLNLKRL